MSKGFRVEFTKQVEKALHKIDRPTKQLIISWIEDRFEGSKDPRKYGKSLAGTLSGVWRYRVGNYRIIAEINEERITIYILNIGHRRDVYK
jgi:mRNA interferase RelE/StbE